MVKVDYMTSALVISQIIILSWLHNIFIGLDLCSYFYSANLNPLWKFVCLLLLLCWLVSSASPFNSEDSENFKINFMYWATKKKNNESAGRFFAIADVRPLNPNRWGHVTRLPQCDSSGVLTPRQGAFLPNLHTRRHNRGEEEVFVRPAAETSKHHTQTKRLPWRRVYFEAPSGEGPRLIFTQSRAREMNNWQLLRLKSTSVIRLESSAGSTHRYAHGESAVEPIHTAAHLFGLQKKHTHPPWPSSLTLICSQATRLPGFSVEPKHQAPPGFAYW